MALQITQAQLDRAIAFVAAVKDALAQGANIGPNPRVDPVTDQSTLDGLAPDLAKKADDGQLLNFLALGLGLGAGPWQPIGFVGGWVDAGGTLGVRKDSLGSAMVSWAVNSGAGDLIGVLPEGWRPPSEIVGVAWSNLGAVKVRVLADGSLYAVTSTLGGSESYGVIVFPAA